MEGICTESDVKTQMVHAHGWATQHAPSLRLSARKAPPHMGRAQDRQASQMPCAQAQMAATGSMSKKLSAICGAYTAATHTSRPHSAQQRRTHPC